MTRKLTITVSEEVYRGLHSVIGRRRISRFIEKLARPHVLQTKLEAAYQEMAEDSERERGALEWADALAGEALTGRR